MGKYYVTTTLPYVNAEPHIGFAMEIIRADVLARVKRMMGDEVVFNTGTDEHGQKIYKKALSEGKDPQEYCDEYASKFESLKTALNLSYNNFIRTTDEHHIKAAQAFWNLCNDNGDIYKKMYRVKYCVGCELEKTDSELTDGHCPFHPNQELENIEEENYFFKFSNYRDRLLELYKNKKDFVVPDFRQNEITNFVKNGLQDFSISRLKSKMPWGVDVPGDSQQVMYVWFDALVNYVSALGWPENRERFESFWPVVQLCGKDNLRQQAAMWQAMLMSAGLLNSKQIIVGGFITSGGQKMSKSLGNVINPLEYVDKFGTDAVRYFLMAEVSVFEDSDVTREKFEKAYQTELANGIGNLAARIAAMAEKLNLKVPMQEMQIREEIVSLVSDYRFNEAIGMIWQKIKQMDTTINVREVWKLDEEEGRLALTNLVKEMRQIAEDLKPFMPDTARKLEKQYGEEEIRKTESLFPRIQNA